MYKNKKICVVVPAYNEEKLIAKTLEGIPDYVDKIVVVDDGSEDSTSRIVSMVKDPRILLIRHEINNGVGAAIVSGYKKSLELEMDITAVMDGDSQMNPLNLPAVLDPVVNGDADYVKGNRLLEKEVKNIMPGIRYIGNHLLAIFTKVASGYWNIMDPQCGYTAISRDTIIRINWEKLYKRYGFENDLLIEMNIHKVRLTDVPVDPIYSVEKSKLDITSFSITVSALLLKGFFRRLKEKYII
ncbi:MAG: glycosyltransferase family 2 protein [Candidatus Altiarchaeota archaeon]